MEGGPTAAGWATVHQTPTATRWLALLLAVAGLLNACSLRGPVVPTPAPAPSPGATQSPGTAQPSPAIPTQPQAPTPERPSPAPPREFHLGTASSALVAQSHAQAQGGDYGQAAATLERALRIEPDNPLLWIELGRVQMGENNFAQADAMGRKALALAPGDVGAQAAAWRLIAESLRARGRNPEAADADRRATALAPH